MAGRVFLCEGQGRRVRATGDHAYRSQGHAPGDLIPIANTNHFTILDELRQPNSTLTRAVLAMAQY
jgi:hypothetical protein